MALPNNGGVLAPQDLGMGRLFESIRDAVIVADANTGRMVLWNPAAENIFGSSTTMRVAGFPSFESPVPAFSMLVLLSMA
jgi:PAS domain-containing protein